MVPRDPATRFVCIQPALSLAALKPFLDSPAAAADLCEPLQENGGGSIGTLKLHVRLLVHGTANQETFRLLSRRASFREPHGPLNVLVDARSLAPLGHRHAPPLRCGNGLEHFAQRPRLFHRFDPRGWPAAATARLSWPTNRGSFEPDVRVGGGVQDVPLPQRPHSLDERRAVAVESIASHPTEREAAPNRLLEHAEGQFRFGPEDDVLRHPGFFPPHRIGRPFFRQEDTAVEENVSFGGVIVEEHAHLAVVRPAQGPRVLPLHAHGLRALLGKARLVDVHNPLVVRQFLFHVLAEFIQHGPIVPYRLADELLQRAHDPSLHALRNVLHIASLALGQQPLHKNARVRVVLFPAKQGKVPLHQTVQLRPQTPQLIDVHVRNPPDS